MTTDEMLKGFEDYYGERYGSLARGLVTEFLDQLSGSERAALARLTLTRYSRRWGKSPDVATLGEYLEEARQLARPVTPAIEYREELTDEEREELGRLMAEAKKTPRGRLLLGIMGGSNDA